MVLRMVVFKACFVRVFVFVFFSPSLSLPYAYSPHPPFLSFHSLFLLSFLDEEPSKGRAKIRASINCPKLTVSVPHHGQARKLQPQKKQSKTDTILTHLCRQSHWKLRLPGIVYQFLAIEIFPVKSAMWRISQRLLRSPLIIQIPSS